MNKGTNEQLSQRVVRSGVWVFSLRMTDRILYVARLVILARILTPSDFGLLGIAMLTTMTLENFSQTGFEAAIIQKKGKIKEYLNSVWTVGIIRGVVLFLILYFIAPYVAIFFETPQAKPIIRVLGLSFLIQAFTNIGIVYFKKELEFKRQFAYQISGTCSDFIVAVLAAVLLRSVWALVLGLIAGNTVRLIMSYIVHPYKPGFNLDLEKTKELFGFGKWVLGSSILIFLITQIDDVLVGKLLGVTMLGYYQMAHKISNIPATEITHVISQVTFPAYSKLQHDIHRMKEAYLKVLQVTLFISFPISGLIYVLSPDFTFIFLGAKWMQMVPAMQVLCFFGAIRSFGATNGPLIYAMGKPDIQTKLAVIQLTILLIIIYPLTTRFGIFGTAVSVLIPNLFTQVIGGTYILYGVKCNITEFSRSLLFPLISTVLMISLITLILNIAKETTAFKFTLVSLCGIICYIGFSYLFGRFFKYHILHTISSLRKL